MCYTPIVIYVYGYVLFDCMYSKTDSSLTKWLTYCLHGWFDSYLTVTIVQFQTAIWGTPLPPTPECMSPELTYPWHGGMALFRYGWNFLRYSVSRNLRLKIFPDIYNVGYQERVKDFFKKAPKHSLSVGDLVTCSCHGGIAIIIELFDKDKATAPSMNMCQIFWIKYPHDGVKERLWMHTIERLYIYGERDEEI